MARQMERIGLRAKRKALGLTQAQLADKLGVARQTLIRWEAASWVTRAVYLHILEIERQAGRDLPDGWVEEVVKDAGGNPCRAYVRRDGCAILRIDADLADMSACGRGAFLRSEQRLFEQRH